MRTVLVLALTLFPPVLPAASDHLMDRKVVAADRATSPAGGDKGDRPRKDDIDLLPPPAPSGRAELAFRPEMTLVPAGSFRMGSDEASVEGPIHSVNVPAFLMATTEVTQAQWRAVVGKAPSNIQDCDECPVEQISWDDIQIYLQKLNARTGKQYRLPSEAEWEYACRAGGTHAYCGSDDLDRVAWTSANSGGQTHPARARQANAFGLYDMSGNVWEWVEDCWNNSYAGAPTDGSAWTGGDCVRRVRRGGSWGSAPHVARSAIRGRFASHLRFDVLGFRIAHSLPASSR